MPLLSLKDGRQMLWEPTTDLLCSACRESVDIFTLRSPTMESANFMFDFRHPSGDGLAQGDYWYLHKRCAHLQDVLIREGASIRWGWHPMGWVLGLDKTMMHTFGRLDRHLKKRMPSNVYDRLYA